MTPSYELVSDELIQCLRSLKTWDEISPLALNFGTVQARMFHVLVGDVLSVSIPLPVHIFDTQCYFIRLKGQFP